VNPTPKTGELTIRMPMFNDRSIYDEFRSRIFPDMSPDDMQRLNQEYQEAVKQAKTAFQSEQKAVADFNLKAFLNNPVAVLQELEEKAGRVFDVGEELLFHGIATVKSVRFGKGIRCGEGTDYPYTSSNFRVTATIGPHTKTQELQSSNDKVIKARMESSCVFDLASMLAQSYRDNPHSL
jgi:hypothetical protein